MKRTLQNISPTYSISNSLFSLAYLFFPSCLPFSPFTFFFHFFGWISSISIAIVLNLKEKNLRNAICIHILYCVNHLFVHSCTKIKVYNKLGYYIIIYNYMGKEVYIAMCVVFQKYMHTCGESVIQIYAQQTLWV
jgi:hypothetical protein